MVPLEEKPPSYFSTIFNESDKNLYQNNSNQYPLNPDRLISQSRRIRPVRNTVAPEVSILRPKKLDINQKVILCRIVTLIGSILFAAALAIIIVYGIIPCSLTKCHSRASICKNYAFHARCICNYGYQGDGKDFCDECGVSYEKPNVRVVGGLQADPGSWPYAVLLIINYRTIMNFNGDRVDIQISFLCGGTLIDRKTVLTAAHCNIENFNYDYKNKKYLIQIRTNKFYPTKESMLRVYVGVDKRSEKNKYPAKYYTVEKLKIHENYVDENIMNDIAILKLEDAVELNTRVQIACLPSPKWEMDKYPGTIPNRTGYVVGWGTEKQFTKSSDTLKNAKVTIYDDKYCGLVIPKYEKNWNRQICAGDLNGQTDTCQGDSGGSLYVYDHVLNKSKHIAAGIVSYGEGCAKLNHPGIYTRISHFLDWIDKNLDY